MEREPVGADRAKGGVNPIRALASVPDLPTDAPPEPTAVDVPGEHADSDVPAERADADVPGERVDADVGVCGC
ncbi:hypothetical protein [Kribbella monticola]|uniref:hypothetical protein n=1 Tax=Kribbella monticola TaxID=2185285 RepID=UPI0013006621|nr:hypothetical protein [Kribbella monticola]